MATTHIVCLPLSYYTSEINILNFVVINLVVNRYGSIHSLLLVQTSFCSRIRYVECFFCLIVCLPFFEHDNVIVILNSCCKGKENGQLQHQWNIPTITIYVWSILLHSCGRTDNVWCNAGMYQESCCQALLGIPCEL